MWIALTRPVSPGMAACELSFREREPIDVARAAAQHAAYERHLESRGIRVARVEAAPDFPDSVFVEDLAVVLDEVAIITRPGAPSRRGEAAGIVQALSPYRPLREITPPGTLDGGDVLRCGRTLFVGRSQRTNEHGIQQLRDSVSGLGYRVEPVAFRGALHLKSAVTAVSDDTLLLNPACVGRFEGFGAIEVHPDEPDAANVLRLGERLLVSESFPKTRARIEERGYAVDSIDVSELHKAEGGLTCCSVIVRVSAGGGTGRR